MSSIPSQVRTVDPFASYNSDTVNKLTRMITRGNPGITATRDLDVVQDSTSPTTVVLVKSGIIFKDDVLIEVTADHRVDFTDSNNYVAFTTGFDEDGWYHIVLEYTYVKSRPAPSARIKILKPSQIPHPSVGTSLFFLKAVYVTGGGPHYIDTSVDFLDYEPSDPTIKREYTDLYFGVEVFLPTHDPETDIGRVVYEVSTDSFWFGYSTRWGKISSGVEVDIDTTGTIVGQLCYVDTDGKAAPAIATGLETGAEMAVAAIGLEVDRSGRALMSGLVTNGRVETGIIVQIGDLLYLSDTEAGRVTNVTTYPVRQVVGRALTAGNETLPITMLFFPRDVFVSSLVGTINPGDWTGPDGDGLYNEVIDISTLGIDSTTPVVLVNVWDATTNEKVYPSNAVITGNGGSLVIYTSDNSVTWNYIISTGGGGAGAGGGGGGGGVIDHSLLLNLDYASSNHTGFAAGAAAGGHGNADHTSTFITATGVTFANLNANGSVGTGAAQVSQGNHTHANYLELSDLNDPLAGYLNRTAFSWLSANSITLLPARYHHSGTINQIVKWNSSINFTFAGLGASQWHYLYIDDSALGGSDTITAGRLINSTTAPVWSATKLGYYGTGAGGTQTTDRCIGVFRTNGSSNLKFFVHSNDFIQWDERITDLDTTALGTSGARTAVTLTIPAICISAQIEFYAFHGSVSDNNVYYAPKGSNGSGLLALRIKMTTEVYTETLRANTDSSQRIDVWQASASTNRIICETNGYFLPKGL